MKKLVLTIALAILGQFVIAQDMQIQNAIKKLSEAQQYVSTADKFTAQNKPDKADKNYNNAKLVLKQAKDAIDAAAQHEKTVNNPKTWYYYAAVYYQIGSNEKMSELDPEAYDKALEAVRKMKQLDMNYYKDSYTKLQFISAIGTYYFNLAGSYYDQGDYENAYKNYKKAYDAVAVIDNQDYVSLLFAAMSANHLKKYDESIPMLEQLIAAGKDDATAYSCLITAYNGVGNTDKVLETISVARAKYPEDAQLINEMIQVYLTLHREAEIIPQIEEMAAKFTERPEYNFILGTIYGNNESELYDMDKALTYYDKSIEQDANFVDSYINAGRLLIGLSAEKDNAANDLPINKKDEYNALKKEAKAYLEQALPYFENAYRLTPDDDEIKKALKLLYVKLGMKDKAAEL